jgi:hypothetical protein
MTRIEKMVKDYEARLERDFTRDGELKKMVISPNVPDNEVWTVPKHWMEGFNGTPSTIFLTDEDLMKGAECNQ